MVLLTRCLAVPMFSPLCFSAVPAAQSDFESAAPVRKKKKERKR